MDKREKAKELFNSSGIVDNAYNWHIWKRAFDLGVAYNKTSDESDVCKCHLCENEDMFSFELTHYKCRKCKNTFTN